MPRKTSTKDPAYTAHSAVNSPPGGTDLLQRLTYEHREIRKLWEDLQRAHIRERGHGHAVDNSRLGDTMQHDVAPQLLQALAEHEALELELLYPAAAQAMNDEWAERARAEHSEIRGLLLDVEVEDPADEAVFEVITGAMTRVMAHMDEEDKVLFPILRMSTAPKDLMIDRHSPMEGKVRPPAPKVIDLTGAERRQLAAAPAGNGSTESEVGNGHADGNRHADADGNGDGNGRRARRGLLRRR